MIAIVLPAVESAGSRSDVKSECECRAHCELRGLSGVFRCGCVQFRMTGAVRRAMLWYMPCGVMRHRMTWSCAESSVVERVLWGDE